MDMEHLLSGSSIAGSRMESYIAVAITGFHGSRPNHAAGVRRQPNPRRFYDVSGQAMYPPQ